MSESQRVVAAFSEDQVERLTGLSKGQLRYWDKTSFYRPSYSEGRSIAYGRIYSFKDVVALRVLSALRHQYQVSLQHLREVSDRLSGSHEDRWIGVKLWAVNRRVIWQDPDSATPQEIVTKQFVVPLMLEDVVNATKDDVQAFVKERDSEKHGKVEKIRHVAHNAPVIAGTRIPVSAIKSFAEAGYSAAQIIEEYPSLSEEDVTAALAYESHAA